MTTSAFFDLTWTFYIIYIVTSVMVFAQEEEDPKSQIENVPGLILPFEPNSVCMNRTDYDCRWTYEKSCSCNPIEVKRRERTLDITLSKKRIKKVVRDRIIIMG